MTQPHQLRRSLTWVQGVPMTVGAVLGSGILILPAVTAEIAGPAAILSWLVMSLLALPLALTLGRLAAALPHAGGIAAYARAAFGPVAGGMVGWLFLGTIPFGVPIVAIIGAGYMGNLLGLSHWQMIALAAAVLGATLVLNHRGIEVSGWVQVGVVSLIAALLVAAALAAASHVRSAAFTPFAPHGWAPVGLAAVIIFWCFVGWEMIAHLAEEFRQPARDIPLSMAFSAGVVALLYLAVAVVTVGTQAYGMRTSLAPLSILVGKGFGSLGAALTAYLALLITFATIHINVAGFSRMVYAQARQGDFPRFFARLHARYQTPTAAFAGLAVVFAVLLLYDGLFAPNLGTLIKWPSVIFLALYMIAMAAALRLLPRGGGAWWLALTALLVCMVIYPFSGWAALYPPALMGFGAVIARRRLAAGRAAPEVTQMRESV